MFQLGHICLQQASLLQVYTSCVYGLSGGGVLVLNQERTASFARQGSNNIEQDGICNQQGRPLQDGFQVGGAKVWIQSHGG